MLHAKEQVTTLEGVPTCQQRLLWRGKPLEPDHVCLCKFGIRSGDTLVVGYRFHRPAVDVPSLVDDDAGIVSNGVMGSEEKVIDLSGESECIIHDLKDNFVRKKHDVPETAVSGADGHNEAVKNTTEGTDLIRSVNAGRTNGELDIAIGDGGSGGSDGSGGGGSSSRNNNVQRHDKRSKRRLWWSNKARSTSKSAHHRERYGIASGGGFGRAAAASFPHATQTHGGASPAPLQRARDNVSGFGGGSGRANALLPETESISAAPGYLLASTRRTRQPPAPLTARAHFSLFVRRNHGRRIPTSSASLAEDADNAE